MEEARGPPRLEGHAALLGPIRPAMVSRGAPGGGRIRYAQAASVPPLTGPSWPWPTVRELVAARQALMEAAGGGRATGGGGHRASATLVEREKGFNPVGRERREERGRKEKKEKKKRKKRETH